MCLMSFIFVLLVFGSSFIVSYLFVRLVIV